MLIALFLHFVQNAKISIFLVNTEVITIPHQNLKYHIFPIPSGK